MANNKEKKIFIHQNLNKQELRQAVIENDTYNSKPTPISGSDVGLLYYDTILDTILIWSGSEWKITQFLDDRDLTYGGDVFIEDIWTQTNLIPPSGPSTSPVLEWLSGITMSNVSNSYGFESTSFNVDNVVPSYKYGDIYKPILNDVNGVTVSNTINWKLERGIVTVYSGFTNSYNLINESNPLFLSYWRYIGNKGDLGSGGTSSVTNTTIITIDSTDLSWVSPYNIIPFVYAIQTSDIVSIAVNGVLVYSYVYDSINQNIILNEAELGYVVDNIDIIRVEIVI